MKTTRFKRGDVVRVGVSGKVLLAAVAAVIEKSGKTRFRLLTEAGKIVEREAVGLKPGEESDREKLTSALAEISRK